MAVTEEKKILVDFANTIPQSLFGPDRMTYLLENIDRLSADQKLKLRNLINKFLVQMIEREASDIELGGFGNQGFCLDENPWK